MTESLKNTLFGKNCLITGATGGIGQALAYQFAKEGCNLFLTSTNKDKLKQLKQQIKQDSNIQVHYKKADLSSIKDIKKLISTIKNKMSHIDILINNAGIFIVKPLEDLTLNDLKKSFDINVLAAFTLSQEFSKKMKKQQWGRIVNIGSSSAYGCSEETMAYAASKHALLGLTKGLHEELSPFNVLAYIVSPAGTQTDMGKKIKNQTFDKFVLPSEIAEYIAFIIKFDKTMVTNELRLNRMVLG